MSQNYLPRGDNELNAWTANFVTYAGANLANLGLVAADLTPVSTAGTAFSGALAANVTAQDAAQSARQAKDTARDTLEAAIRALVARLQPSAAVSDAERAALGITVPDPTRTPAPVPTTRPVGIVDTRQRRQHTIHFADEGTPTSKAKPAGVQGCEIWFKIGGNPPTSASELTYLATDTKTPYVAEYEGTDLGQTAHYMLRWVNTRGERGPWSETVSATIGA